MNFDYSFLLAITGFIATIYFGIQGLLLAKSRTYPGELTFIPEQAIGLFDSIVKNFPQISITYDEQNISDQIVLLKGYLLNTGSIDIKEQLVEMELSITLPENFKWVDTKIVDSSEGIAPTTKIQSDNGLAFHLGLFRKDEFLRFEALAEVPSPENKSISSASQLMNSLKFKHRIADTKEVKVNPRGLKLKSLKDSIFIYSSSLLVIILFTFTIFPAILNTASQPLNMFYYELSKGDSSITLTATPNSLNTVQLGKTDGSIYQTVPLESFNQDFKKVEIRKRVSTDSNIPGGSAARLFSKYIGLIFLYPWGLLLFNHVKRRRNVKRLRKILNLNSSEMN